MKKFKDNSTAPIIAIDFDNTIHICENFPQCGQLRPYVKEVINFLFDIGIKIIIYTCREFAENKLHDHISPMIEYLKEHNIKYSAINSSTPYAPFIYESRKLYAHMYVDDRGFGWIESKYTFAYILLEILRDLLGILPESADVICYKVINNLICEHDIEQYKNHVKSYWK